MSFLGQEPSKRQGKSSLGLNCNWEAGKQSKQFAVHILLDCVCAHMHKWKSPCSGQCIGRIRELACGLAKSLHNDAVCYLANFSCVEYVYLKIVPYSASALSAKKLTFISLSWKILNGHTFQFYRNNSNFLCLNTQNNFKLTQSVAFDELVILWSAQVKVQVNLVPTWFCVHNVLWIQ